MSKRTNRTAGSADTNDGSIDSITGEPRGIIIENEPVAGAESIAGFEPINPADIGDGPSTGTGKKRGRKPGSKNSKGKEVSTNLKGLEKLLLSIHGIGASMLSIPALRIDKDEAKLLADAISEVAEHYSFEIDPKYAALVNLGTVAFSIYAPRVYAARTGKAAIAVVPEESFNPLTGPAYEKRSAIPINIGWPDFVTTPVAAGE